MSNAVEDFLTAAEEQVVIDAIRIAEKNTSGEIRVHLEDCCDGKALERAVEVFSILKMYNTKLQNAVLIYVAVQDHAFAIYGDRGIDAIAGETFWDSTKDLIQSHFLKRNFAEGLSEGVLKIGQLLKQEFPWNNDDENELHDTISKS